MIIGVFGEDKPRACLHFLLAGVAYDLDPDETGGPIG